MLDILWKFLLWAGLTPDLVIEQVLMRRAGDLTLIRGFDVSSGTQWLYPSLHVLKLCVLSKNLSTRSMAQLSNIGGAQSHDNPATTKILRLSNSPGSP
ncbi:hypothetical protein ElyMa_000986600 [Elysia marginata]|uniref:Uncharacterized protein n=1 Tax=Elysia marginata TaxID=1093978 RepID=A0AAV4HJE7_9GAST|nr:hypothetical protein ElyMa_000986600 [Elysia marginata]